MKRVALYGTAIAVGLIIIGALVTASIWPVINEVETGKTPEYPEIVPQYYTAEPARVIDESRAAVEHLELWDVDSVQSTPSKVVATRTTRTMGFVDDVTISVRPVTDFVTQVHVHSQSRVGKGDFGQNARNIEEFFTELDNRIGALRFIPEGPEASDASDEEAMSEDAGS